MMTLNHLKVLYFILVVSLVTIIIYVSQIYSIDIVRYEISFGNSFSAFEPGWRILGSLSSYINFDQFLWLIYILQALLIALIYKRSKAVIYLPIVLLIIAPSLYTNQIRWGVATLFVILFFLRSYNIIPMIAGLIFHKYVILLSPILYIRKHLHQYLFIIFIIALFSLSSYFLIRYFEGFFGFSYLENQDTSSTRSLIGTGFSILVLLSYYSLSYARRTIEIKTLYMLNLMSLGFFWIAVVSGRLSDASTILEPFIVRELVAQKSIISFLLSLFFIVSWVLRLYIRWAT